MQVKRSVFSSAVLAALLAAASCGAYAHPDSDEALAAAQRDLAQFAAHQEQQHPGGAPQGFPLDVSDTHDLQDARIGHGFQVYTIDPQDLLHGRGDLDAMIRPTGQWRFVVDLHGKAIGLATVALIGGHYQTVSYGAAVLAKDAEALMAHHGNADRSNLRFVRVYQAQADLLEVTGADGHSRFAPLQSAREALLRSAAPLVESDELLEPLRAAVKSNLEAFR